MAKTKLACCGRRRGKRGSGVDGGTKGGDGRGEGDDEVGAGRRRRSSTGGSKA